MTAVRTLDAQITIWMRSALTCYGLTEHDLRKKGRIKIFAGGLDLLRTHGPKAAREHVFDVVDKCYRLKNWDKMVAPVAIAR